ncbi:MAG: amidophosphoribosyltransferase [Pseudomonadota bacterium]
MITARTASAYLDQVREKARKTHAYADLLAGDRLHEECGVFGVWGAPDAAGLAVIGAHALQHRGQEGAGVVSTDRERFFAERGAGLVSDVFSREERVAALNGEAAVSHTRYSTQGGSSVDNIQPLFANLGPQSFALAHNGNLTNSRIMRRQLMRDGALFRSRADTEVFLHLAGRSRGATLVDRLVDALWQVEGSYALVALGRDMMIGARDPVGIRPLVLGKLGGAHILASETCALDLIGAEFVRDVAPGEVVVVTEHGVESRKPFPHANATARSCIFELLYFARPNSIVDGKSVYELRKAFGRQLAREAAIDADIVSPIPESGVPAAIGYAAETGVPFELGIIRSHYVGRTFIAPRQDMRELGVKKKHSINRSQMEGKRVVFIDDTLVRGTTSKQLVRMAREAGAKEVHIRIASPPIKHPDYYGIDTPSKEELMGANYTVEEIRRQIGADSLAYLSVDGLYEALGAGPRDAAAPAFTDHCFTGDYPTPTPDATLLESETSIEQLSLLAEPV